MNEPIKIEHIVEHLREMGSKAGYSDAADALEALSEAVDTFSSKLDSAMKALRAAKHDLDITSWECPRCGESTPMHVIDMYDPLAEALRVLDGRCDGNHSEPPCADPQCWNGGVANEQNR